ncbi:MAG: hypothetical protein ABSA86_11655 [Oryzomonas sp.]|jgi:hypothetical protein
MKPVYPKQAKRLAKSAAIFKICPCCATEWPTKIKLLSDPSLKLHGYQGSYKNRETGVLLFTHLNPSCGSTMALDVSEFSDLYTGATYCVGKALSAEYPRYCVDPNFSAQRGTFCECGYVRDIMCTIRTLQTAA